MNTNGACERIGTLLAEWISGALDAEDSAEVRTHLATCETCRAEEREMRGMIALLEADAAADSGVRDPGDAYWNGFATRVSAKLPEKRAVRVATGLFSWLRFPRLATGLAAAAVLVIALKTGIPTGRTPTGVDTESVALFEESMAPPSLDGIAALGEAELDRLGRELASAGAIPRGAAPPLSGTSTPNAGTKTSIDERAGGGARGEAEGRPSAIDPVRVPAPAMIDDLSPEELDELLERLDAFET